MNPFKKAQKNRTWRFIYFGGHRNGLYIPICGTLPQWAPFTTYGSNFFSFVLANWRSEPFLGSRPACPNKTKNRTWRFIYFGGRAGTRTLDPLIKSQLLYQLSYASKTNFLIRTGVIIDFFLSNASLYHNHFVVCAILYVLYLLLSVRPPVSLHGVNHFLNNQTQTQHHAIHPMPSRK